MRKEANLEEGENCRQEGADFMEGAKCLYNILDHLFSKRIYNYKFLKIVKLFSRALEERSKGGVLSFENQWLRCKYSSDWSEEDGKLYKQSFRH